MTDPIADFITRIKNSGDALKETASAPYSKIKFDIANLLKKEGFIQSVEQKGKTLKTIEIGLVSNGKEPFIRGVKRISKPGRRIYKKAKDIRPVKNGYGHLIISTPNGIMTGYAAKKAGLGGEPLFEIW